MRGCSSACPSLSSSFQSSQSACLWSGADGDPGSWRHEVCLLTHLYNRVVQGAICVRLRINGPQFKSMSGNAKRSCLKQAVRLLLL